MKLVRLLAATALFCSLPSVAQQIQINKENKTIAITTSDEAGALADIASVAIGFQHFGQTEQATYEQASTLSNAISAALTGAGVPKEAVESTGQNLRPLMLNGEEDKTRYAQGLRFAFAQNWRVTVPAGQAASILQAAISAGANSSGDIQWRLSTEQALEAEAARKALEHAQQIASSMATGLGVKLGTLVYAGNQAPPMGLSPMMAGMGPGAGGNMGAGYRRIGKPLAIAPERITRSATVYAVFAIE